MQGYPNIHSPGGGQGLPPFQHSPERHQQVVELTSQIASCRALNRDQSLFETPVRLQDGRSTNLRLILPPRFPQERPGLQVTHPIQHPWVNHAGRMSFPALDQWHPSHSRLAPVVQEAYAALTGQPLRSPAASPQRPASASSQRDSSPIRPASVPSEFPQVQAMGNEELLAILTDDDKYRQLAASIAGSSRTTKLLQQLREGNRQLAQDNLSQETVLAELRNQIAIIRSSEYAVVRENFDGKHARQKAVLGKLQPQCLVDALAAQAAQAEAEADALQESFKRGEVSSEAFVERYTQLRKVFHQRDLKCQAARQTLVSA